MAFGKERVPTPKEDRLPFLKFMAWKSSDISSAAVFWVINTYLMQYCSDFLGMSTLVVGNILLVSNIIDFFTDFIAAYIIDNTNTKWGRGRPYEISIVGMTLCTIVLFMVPAGANDIVKILWVFFMYTTIFGVFNTLRSSAQSVYCIRAWNNNRTVIGKLSSYGGFVTTVGSMVITMTFPVLMSQMATSAEGWMPLVAIFMIPLTLIGVLRFIFVKEPAATESQKHEKVDLKGILNMMKLNKYAWFFGAMVLLFNAITSLGTASYYWTYVVGNTAMMGVLSIFSILLLPMMLIMPPLMKKFTATQIITVFAGIASIGYLINFFAGSSIPILMAGALLSAMASLPLSYLGIIIILELCRYNRYLGIPAMESSVTAVFNGFGTQLGQGIGGWLTGAMLALAGYVSATGDQIVTQPDSAIMMIRLLHSIVPMVMMLLLGVCTWKLTKLSKQIPQIEKELAERESAQA